MSDEHNFVSGVEQELIDATSFVPEKKYKKRQDYLGALLRAVSDLDDEDYDKLSDEAAEWCDAAVTAHKARQPLPDFQNGEDPEADTKAEELDEELESAESESTEAGEGLEHEELEHDKPKSEKKNRGRPKGSKGKPKEPKAAKPKKEPKEPHEKKGRQPPRGNNEWGIANSSKSDLVCRMLAQQGGTTMKDIVQATGQAHYNLVHRLQRYGHTIIKNGLNLRLIHKDKAKEQVA